MFVRADAVVIDTTIRGEIDRLLDRAEQRLVPNPVYPDQPVSEVRRYVMRSERSGGPLALGRKGKQPCRYTSIIA